MQPVVRRNHGLFGVLSIRAGCATSDEQLPVGAFDRIDADSVVENVNGVETAYFYLYDSTTNAGTFGVEQTAPQTPDFVPFEAEWMESRPAIGYFLYPMPDYGPSFTVDSAEAYNVNGGACGADGGGDCGAGLSFAVFMTADGSWSGDLLSSCGGGPSPQDDTDVGCQWQNWL